MNDRMRNKGRMAIYSMAGVYLLFMAYYLFKGLPTAEGNERLLMIVFMIFFGIVGSGMVIFGIVAWYRMTKNQANGLPPAETEQKEDE